MNWPTNGNRGHIIDNILYVVLADPLPRIHKQGNSMKPNEIQYRIVGFFIETLFFKKTSIYSSVCCYATYFYFFVVFPSGVHTNKSEGFPTYMVVVRVMRGRETTAKIVVAPRIIGTKRIGHDFGINTIISYDSVGKTKNK